MKIDKSEITNNIKKSIGSPKLSNQEIKPKCEYRRFIIEDPEVKKRFESLFEKKFITQNEFKFAITTLKQCWDNWNNK